METITAKFNSKCTASGKSIKKGQTIIYDRANKKAYLPEYAPKNEEINQDGLHVQANEDAYFDHFCQMNNI